MRATVNGLVAIALLAALSPSGASAQNPPAPPPAPAASPAHTHVGHVMDGFRGTPNGAGLLTTTLAEAKIVAEHAALAAKDPANLDAMKQHAAHVLHAIDPTLAEGGPGQGYGLKKAADGAATHIDLAAKSEGASQNVKTHASHITASVRNTAQRADQLAALAKRIQEASSAAEAASLVSVLNALAQQLMAGTDINGDGRIGWQEAEGGLQQAEQHMGLLKKGEGMS
ncbi:MAG: hypothetical protein ACREMQ_17325 [Longimicrobiales bacterium]